MAKTNWQLHNMAMVRADEARSAFISAACIEERALESTPPSKRRLRSVLSVSAACLWLKAERYGRAEEFAKLALKDKALEPFALRQLREVLREVKRRTK